MNELDIVIGSTSAIVDGVAIPHYAERLSWDVKALMDEAGLLEDFVEEHGSDILAGRRILLEPDEFDMLRTVARNMEYLRNYPEEVCIIEGDDPTDDTAYQVDRNLLECIFESLDFYRLSEMDFEDIEELIIERVTSV